MLIGRYLFATCILRGASAFRTLYAILCSAVQCRVGSAGRPGRVTNNKLIAYLLLEVDFWGIFFCA